MALTQLKTAAIADDAVTEDKLANAINTARAANTAKTTNATHTGDVTGSGSLTIADNAVTLAKMAGGTDGQIITYDASGDPVAVGPGTDGQVLTSTGAGSPPAFEAIPASGKAHNLIINGACRIAQRGTSSSSSGYQTVDRFKHSGSGWDSAITQKQVDVASGTTPYTEGFRKSFQLTNGGQSSGGQAGDQLSISYIIEDQDLATSGWNYLSATSYVTLSFWFKSSINQTFYVVLESKDGTSRQYSFAITPTGAGTWTKVTHTIPGNSGLQFSNDNGEGIEIYFLLFYGTNQTTSSHTLNTWKTTNGGDQAPDMTATWFETDNALFDITGLQLEVGSVATDFEHRRYADELRSCQRYYFQDNTARYHYGSYAEEHYHFPVTLRVNPTVTLVSVPSGGSVNRARINWVTITGMGSNTGNIEVKADAEL